MLPLLSSTHLFSHWSIPFQNFWPISYRRRCVKISFQISYKYRSRLFTISNLGSLASPSWSKVFIWQGQDGVTCELFSVLRSTVQLRTSSGPRWSDRTHQLLNKTHRQRITRNLLQIRDALSQVRSVITCTYKTCSVGFCVLVPCIESKSPDGVDIFDKCRTVPV